MAINIQEILHPSDSDAIKFEKINYNFDQIVANGGGPTGQKGNQGIQGSKGNVGAKGQKGDLGEKGETGATTSRWEVITVNPDSAGTYSILKPKLLTDDIHPHVWLGDQLFNENTGADGQTTIRATITIGKNAQGTAGYDSDEYIRFWHGADLGGNAVSIDMQSTDISADNSVRYEFGKSFDADPGTIVEFKASFDKFTIAPTSTFKVPVVGGTDAANQQPEIGLVRYNTDTNVFEGGVSDGLQTTWTSFCMAPCGQGTANYSISISPEGDISVNETGTPTGNSVSFTPADSVEVDAFGETWVDTTTSTTSTTTTTEPPETTTTTSTSTSTTTALPSYQHTLSYDNGDAQVACGSSTTYQVWSDDQTLTLSSVFWSDEQLTEFSSSTHPSGWYSNGAFAWLITNTGGGSVTATETCEFTATWNITEQIVNGKAYQSLNSNTEITQLSATATPGNTAQATVWVGGNDATYLLTAQDMTGYTTTLGTSSLGNDTTNSNGETRVPITVSYTMANADATGTLTLEGSATLTEYTVQYINGTTNNYDTCQLTTNVKTATYTQSSAGNFGVVSSAIVNDSEYTGTGNNYCKIVSSNENGFTWAGYVFSHAYQAGGNDCDNINPPQNGNTVVYSHDNTNFGVNLVYYNLDAQDNVQAAMSSPAGGGSNFGSTGGSVCSLKTSYGAPSDPFFVQYQNYCIDSNEGFPCSTSGFAEIAIPPGSSITQMGGCYIN